MNLRTTLVLLAACSIALATTACDSGDSDSGSAAAADVTVNPDPSDSSADTDAAASDIVGENDSTQTGPEDVPAVDPCESDPCATAPGPECGEDGTVMTYEDGGACSVDDAGSAICEWTSTSTACAEGEVCASGACAAAGDPNEYAFSGDASYLSELTVPGMGESCCFDFTGDGVPDNKLGTLLATLESQFNVNELISDAILDGSISIVFEHSGLDDASDDEEVGLNGFICDSDDSYEDKAAGNGNFTADASSFVPGTATPLIAFGSAAIAAGVMTAGPSLFILSLPLLEGVDLNLTIHNTQIEALSSPGTSGTGLDLNEGKLGGVIPLGELYNALNAFGESQCSCLGLDGPLISWMGEGTTAVCSSDYETDACNADPDTETCSTIAGACGLVTTLLKADIDTNANGVKDAISIGLNFKGVSANLTGITAE